jgi:hypothetical protein
VRPSSARTLSLTILVTAVLGWVLFDTSYSSLVALPTYAPVTAGLVALFELGLAKVVRDKMRQRTYGKQMHPLQIARAAALARATSAAGSLLLGLYIGFSVWTLPRRDELNAASDDAKVAVISVVVFLVLLIAALVLEHVCRTSPHDD